jgi:hypothetical protein
VTPGPITAAELDAWIDALERISADLVGTWIDADGCRSLAAKMGNRRRDLLTIEAAESGCPACSESTGKVSQ